MTYENAERYLLLKQLLVTFTVVRKGAMVNIGGIDYNEPMVVSRVLLLLDEIETYFSIPYGLLRNGPIELNLEGIPLYITELCTDEMKDGLALTAVNLLTDPANLEKSIYNYPIKNIFVQEYNQNVAEDSHYHSARHWAGEMVSASVDAVRAIREWVRFENKMCLEQCIILSNCIELTDWLFSYTNDLYGVDHVPTE